MKNATVVACTFFLLLSIAGFAQAPSKAAPLTREAIAAILGLSPAGGGCATKGLATAPSQITFASQKEGPGGGVGANAICQANCESGSVSCEGNISCQAFDRNCTAPNCERGHVTCNDTMSGTTTIECPTACPGGFCCTCVATGSCYDCCRCDGGTQVQCNNCCTCEATSDCNACCRCEGHSPGYCALLCA
jgi:hypothetical protein